MQVNDGYTAEGEMADKGEDVLVVEGRGVRRPNWDGMKGQDVGDSWIGHI